MRFTRRSALGLAGAGVGAIAVAGASAYAVGSDSESPEEQRYPFYGGHQAGILTPAQDRLAFAAFDVTTTDRKELVGLLKAWTAAAARMTQGEPVETGRPESHVAPPQDTGETIGLSAARLTLTFGFGPSLFTGTDGADRFGIGDKQPAQLKPLPHFPGDQLDPHHSGGDLCVQACADDPQVAIHAIRNLAKLAFGTAALRWTQIGFGRTSSTTTSQATPRNLFGFKDGTANIRAEEEADVRKFVWVDEADDPGAAWLDGGSFLAARRINMAIETWDRTPLGEQEMLIGRDRPEGAPMSGGAEFTEPDFDAKDSDGNLKVAMDSHVRLAHPDFNNGARILRRGYNFADGIHQIGTLDAGLFFLAYMRDPATQYLPMQNTLSSTDGLMEYLKHTGSGIFAVPPGVAEGGYLGETLFT